MFPTATKVLIVDDRMTIRKRVRKAMADEGLGNLIEAPDTSSAWAAALELLSIGTGVDLVVLSPKSIDLIVRMRAHPELGRASFVLLASETERARLPDARALGLIGYLPRPAGAEFASALREMLHDG